MLWVHNPCLAMVHTRTTMHDLLLALSVTVLSSTAGLAVSSVVPPSDWWQDPRLLAPLLSAAVNGIWLLWRIWRRRQARQMKLGEQFQQWARQEAEYVLRIQVLEAEQSKSVALIKVLEAKAKDLRADLDRQPHADK